MDKTNKTNKELLKEAHTLLEEVEKDMILKAFEAVYRIGHQGREFPEKEILNIIKTITK